MSLRILLLLCGSLLLAAPSLAQEAAAQEGEEAEAQDAPAGPGSIASIVTVTNAAGEAVRRAVAADGRMQQLDAYGNPVVDPQGRPVWEATSSQRAQQLFEEVGWFGGDVCF